MSVRVCEECGKHLISHRKGARFCDSDCKNAWHNKNRSTADAPRKRLQAAREPATAPRRRSKDGFGARLYFTPKQLDELWWLCKFGPDALSVDSVERIARKAKAAEERLQRKEPA